MIETRGLWELVELRAAASPDMLFAVDEYDRHLSFAEYHHAAERCAAGLSALGVGPGTPVSWMLPTRLESLVLVGALSRLGAVQNPILPIYREREVQFVTHQSTARFIFVPGIWRGFDYPAMARKVAVDQDELEVVVIDPSLPDGDPDPSNPPVPPDSDEVRWIFYTSGTTADPKGARHSDGNLLAAARGMCNVLQLDDSDRVALVFPFTHIGGICWLLCGLLVGSAHITIEVFDPATSIDVLARNGVTQATAGTAFHQAYLEAQRAHADEVLFPAVRSFPGGGAPKPPQLHYDIVREMGGVGIVSGYGLTECPVVAMNSVEDPDEKLANTEGRPNPPELQIRVVTLEGKPAGVGEEGELRVRGPQLCKGYVDASLDADGFDEEGFFRTGDLGYLDADDFVVITGRLKDVIIRKGENISAKEVEDLLYQHPKIADVAVIGLPDPRSGERACAVVACRGGEDPITFAEMSDFLRGRDLMLQKLPEQLEIVDEIPRNSTGKVLKRELRERYSADA